MIKTISYLSYLSKYIEKVIASQIVKHLNKNSMMEKFESAHIQSHSTETALLLSTVTLSCQLFGGML